VEDQTDIWKAHLRFGGQPDHHQGKYTDEAALYPQPDCLYSRLPLDDMGERVQVALTDVSEGLRTRITNRLHGKCPVLLSGPDLRSILKLLDDQTAVAVVGNVVPNDDTFSRVRIGQETQCTTCWRKASKPAPKS
jgi:hypothetical protein